MELPQPLQSESPTPVRRFFGGGCRWESPLCAVSERVEQRLGLKKREKREKEKTIDAEPPRRMRCIRQACHGGRRSTAARPARTTQRPDRIGSLAPISSFFRIPLVLSAGDFYFSTEAYLSRRHSFFCCWPHSVISLLVEDAGVFRRSSIALR